MDLGKNVSKVVVESLHNANLQYLMIEIEIYDLDGIERIK